MTMKIYGLDIGSFPGCFQLQFHECEMFLTRFGIDAADGVDYVELCCVQVMAASDLHLVLRNALKIKKN